MEQNDDSDVGRVAFQGVDALERLQRPHLDGFVLAGSRDPLGHVREVADRVDARVVGLQVRTVVQVGRIVPDYNGVADLNRKYVLANLGEEPVLVGQNPFLNMQLLGLRGQLDLVFEFELFVVELVVLDRAAFQSDDDAAPVDKDVEGRYFQLYQTVETLTLQTVDFNAGVLADGDEVERNCANAKSASQTHLYATRLSNLKLVIRV